MFKSNRDLIYLICLFPVIVFIAFGLLKMHSLNLRNQSLHRSIQGNQRTVMDLNKQQRGLNLAHYEKGMSQQGADLYRAFPQVDKQIKAMIDNTYGKVNTSDDYDKKINKAPKMMKGSFPKGVLDHIKPQTIQGSQRPVSPYSSVQDVHTNNYFSNYNQGNVIVLTDITYTIPSQTVTAGRKLKLPSEQRHDYYLSSYNVSDHQLDALDTNHSQGAQGGDE